MKKILSFLAGYLKQVDERIFLSSAGITAFAIFSNYYWDINGFINNLESPYIYLGWYLVFIAAFGSGYLLRLFRGKTTGRPGKEFWLLFFMAPAIFAWKMAFDPVFQFSGDHELNDYWNRVVYWPFKLVVVTLVLLGLWMIFDRKREFYGLSAKEFSPRPYFIMLLIMVPLVAAASTQPDFLHTYPKLKHMDFLRDDAGTGWYQLLYELSYGSDFFTIELFFRGFLVLAFAKWVGKDAILPMAMFYCTIHFGKPLGECISSYFGGIILGVVTYHTRSIYGGFIVHVGIAWMMELGGFLSHRLQGFH